MEKIILFDIDLTLFDSLKLRNIVSRDFIKYFKTTEKEFREVQQKYLEPLKSSTDFNVDDYLKHLAKHFKKDFSELESLYFDQKVFEKCLYRETLKVLRSLYKNFRLGVFSEGFNEFQLHKLKLSGIYRFFDKDLIFISRRKMENDNLSKIDKKWLIVEDNVQNAEKLYELGFSVNWLNRRDDSVNSKVKTIRALEELI